MSSSSDLELSSVGASQSEHHDNLDMHYTRTYMGGDHNISVSNGNSSSVGNDFTLSAFSGDNESEAGNGDNGGMGGSLSTSGNSSSTSSNTAGHGGAGGDGGVGGTIMSGASNSNTSVLTVIGRSITHILRN